METAARFASRHMEPAGDALVPIPPERERALRVTVNFTNARTEPAAPQIQAAASADLSAAR